MEILIPLTFFAMIAAIVLVPRYLKSQERLKLQDTLRTAIEKGQPLPAEVVAAISTDVKPVNLPSPERDMRRGILWLGAAAGLVACGLVAGMSEPDATYHLIAIAAFPGFIGAAMIVVAMMSKSKS